MTLPSEIGQAYTLHHQVSILGTTVGLSCLILSFPPPSPDPSAGPVYAPLMPSSGTSPSASIRSNFLTSSVVVARIRASTTRFFSSGVINLPFPPFALPPTPPMGAAPLFVDVDKAAPLIVDVDGMESCCARSFGRPVDESVRSLRASVRVASLIRVKSSV